jgi:hypothetical protein
MLDSDKIDYIASQIALRPDQRRALHEHLKPYTKNIAPLGSPTNIPVR